MATSKMPTSRATTAYGLLSEIRKLILAEPKRYDQRRYIMRRRNPDGMEDVPMRGFPACGRVGCVAGWVATLTQSRRFACLDAYEIARAALGLDRRQSRELFGVSGVNGEPQTSQHARSGVAHIARFQRKYASQLKAKAV